MYEIFGYMPDDWYFFDGNTYEWWNDCTLINGVDGTAGFTIHGIAFRPESMPVVRTGSGCRPSVRTLQQALSAAAMLAPDPDRSRTTAAVRLTVDKPIHRSIVAARFASRQPALTGFGNPALDSLQPNLVCVWKLEEGAGTRIDAISGEDLSTHNGPTSAAGKDGQACVFVNASSHGLYRDQNLLGPLGAHEVDTEIAFSTWLYANTVGYRSIGGFIDEMGGMGPWSLSLGYQNRIYLNINTYNWNDSAYAQTGSISAGQWYNLVFTFASTGHLRLYVNGALVATGDTYAGTGGLAEPYSPFTLGCGQVYDYEHDTTGFGNSWDGLIDETCVWNAVPDDPDAFAAALWNGGRGAFYRIDTTRRAASCIAATARQQMDILRRERVEAAANLAVTGTATRFDAVARLVRARPVVRTSARVKMDHRRSESFESIFGLNPSHAGFAHRADARMLTGSGFGNPVLDALGQDLACCWKLEENTGKRIDAVAGENLTPHNTPTNAPGVNGQANRFSNAQTDGLYRAFETLGPLGSHGPGAELAFSTWLYANTVGYRSIAGFIDEMGGMGPWSLSLGYQNRIYLNINTYNWNDSAHAQTGSISAGQWYNIAFTFSSTGHLRLYVNGALAATGDTYGGTGGLAEPYSPFTLGCGQVYDYEHDTTGFGNSWDGLIDETCVWNAVPDDPDAFAAALWNGGRGAFYRIDTTRRAASGIAATARQRMDILRRERVEATANLAATGTATRFDAVTRLVRAHPAVRSSARARSSHRRTDLFDFIFGLNPTRAAFAHRAVVRRTALASAGTDAHASARHSTIAIDGERIVALAETVLTGIAARFEAVAYRNYQVTGPRPAARVPTLARTPVGFDLVFGIDPIRAAIAARPAARQLPGTVFGNPVLDAIGEHLVACWKLEEDTGERIDAISGEHLTPHNAPTAAPGRDGQANRFSNAQANGLFREMADLGPLGSHGPEVELSVSTWLYADSLGYRSVAGFIDEMGYMGPWSMSVGYQNRLYVNIATPDWDNAYVQSGSLSAGQWYHVFFTYDASGNVRLYLNGVLAATGSTYSGNGGLAQSYSPFTLGCGQAYDYEHDTYGYGNSWDGLIDETCVWNAVPENPDVFAAALWNAGRGTFLHIDPRQRAVIAARGDLRADTLMAAGVRMTADQELARCVTPARALATRYTTETNTAAWADARARHRLLRVVRADAEYIVALTRVLGAVRAGVHRDMDAVNCARTVLGFDARSTTTTAGAAFLKALVERLHADHGVRLGAGTKATFTASGDLFDIRAVNRVTTGEHPGARKLLIWTIPHLTSARDKTGNRTPILHLARARQDALHRVRLTLRAPQTAAVQSRHDAFIQAGWRLLARKASTGEELDLGFVAAGNDAAGGTLVDVALPDGDWQIEPRPAEWFWSDCRGRAASSVSIREGRILHAGLPAILNLRGEILNQRRVVRWEIAAELLPQSFHFGIWTGATSPVDTTGQPLATVPFSDGRGSYLHAFTQSEPLHLAVAAFDGDGMGPEAEIFLDWASAPPASPVNQLAR
jgi:hypothetical protein